MNTGKALLTSLFLFAFICQGQTERRNSVKIPHFKEFYRTITKQFERIDYFNQHGAFDSLKKENDEVISTLNRYKTWLFDFPDSLNYDLIYLTKSADKKFALVSWDRRLGGTWIEFTTMAIFKTPQGVSTKMLMDSTNKSMPYTYMHYNTVKAITASNGKTIYLAWGNGQGSTAIPWQEVRAFSIVDGKLIEPMIFPDKKSNIYVEFDLHDFTEVRYVPSIKIKNGGRTIQVPIDDTPKKFSGKYKRYIFNGKTFIGK